MATIWSKVVPGYKVEALGEPDGDGNVAVYGVPPYGDPEVPLPLSYGVVPVSEFSWEETTPVPESVPKTVFVLIYGKDPVRWTGSVHPTREEAEAAMSKKKNAIGYFETTVIPASMITP